MRQSGAKLVEVGTTNCTNLPDYEQAITDRTAALLRVHSSNFKIIGFTEEVTIQELIELGRRNELLVLDDLGSGCLLDTTKYRLAPEPMVQDSISAGVSLAFCSGDKLFGGPQAGIIVGKKPLIDKLKKHPLARAIRIDKTRLAGLAVTLVHYIKGEAEEKIPVWRMITMPLEDIGRRAQDWKDNIGEEATVIDGESVVGGGSLPDSSLPTRLVAVKGSAKREEGINIQETARSLRLQELPIIGRIDGNTLLLDPRTVLPEDDSSVIKSLRSVFR
jgi:L-seryl-tRNA(Ser) seleniumtransferase